VTKHKHISEDTFKVIDSEIRKIIDTNYQMALKILEVCCFVAAIRQSFRQFENRFSPTISDFRACFYKENGVTQVVCENGVTQVVCEIGQVPIWSSDLKLLPNIEQCDILFIEKM
jgi:hypothetical protein